MKEQEENDVRDSPIVIIPDMEFMASENVHRDDSNFVAHRYSGNLGEVVRVRRRTSSGGIHEQQAVQTGDWIIIPGSGVSGASIIFMSNADYQKWRNPDAPA